MLVFCMYTIESAHVHLNDLSVIYSIETVYRLGGGYTTYMCQELDSYHTQIWSKVSGKGKVRAH